MRRRRGDWKRRLFQDRTKNKKASSQEPLTPIEDVEYTYNEDVLLVSAIDMGKMVVELPQDSDDMHSERLLWKTFSETYEQHRAQLPHLFPREGLEVYDLRRRLVDLKLSGSGKGPSARYRLIDRDIRVSEAQSEQAASEKGTRHRTAKDDVVRVVVVAMDAAGSGDASGGETATGGEEEEDEDEDEERATPRAELGLIGAERQGRQGGARAVAVQLVVDPPRYVASRNTPKIQIGLSGRHHKNATLTTERGPLVAESRLLARLTEDFVPNAEQMLPRVHLTDKGEAYDGMPTFNLFSEANLRRFELWCHNPTVMQMEKGVRKRLEAVSGEYASLHRDLHRETETRKSQRLASLDRRRRREESRMRTVYDRQFQRDLRALEAHHEQLVQAELSRLNAKYRDLERRVEAYYDAQVMQMRQIADRLAEIEVTHLEAQAAAIRGVADRVFTPSTVLPLALLAEAIEADRLRGDCVQYVADNFSAMWHRPELASPLLTDDTRRELLARVSDAQVAAAAGSNACVIDHGLIDRELMFRRAAAAQALTQAPLYKLNAMLVERDTPFLDLVASEVARRRSSAPGVKIGPQQMSPHASRDGMRLSVSRLHRYALAQASVSKAEDTAGDWYWEAEIVACPSDAMGGAIVVGLDVPRASCDGPIPGVTASDAHDRVPEGLCGIAWQSDGFLHDNGTSRHIGIGFGRGDVVGVALLQSERIVQFYKNGERLKRIASHVDPVRITTSVYTLFPAVCLYATQDVRDCIVQLNFEGPFSWQLPRTMLPFGDTGAEQDESAHMSSRHSSGVLPHAYNTLEFD